MEKKLFLGEHFDNSHNLISLDNALMLLGENWCWSLLGLKRLLKKESRNEEGHLFATLSEGGGGKANTRKGVILSY